MFKKVTFFISGEDQLNIERVQRQHPDWPPAVIFRRALGLFADQLAKGEPQPSAPEGSFERDITDLFGPQD